KRPAASTPRCRLTAQTAVMRTTEIVTWKTACPKFSAGKNGWAMARSRSATRRRVLLIGSFRRPPAAPAAIRADRVDARQGASGDVGNRPDVHQALTGHEDFQPVTSCVSVYFEWPCTPYRRRPPQPPPPPK